MPQLVESCELCPECGAVLLLGYRFSSLDPDDAEPAALCSRRCGFGY